MSQFDDDEDARNLFRIKRPFFSIGKPKETPKSPGWPRCAIHNIEGHMAGSVACRNMTKEQIDRRQEKAE